MPTVLAVVTARGGSKGLPHKNVTAVAGRPLIAWTIESALGASTVGRVIVSTDDEEIADVSRNAGAEVPFLRPRELAGDDAPHVPVLVHAVTWLEEKEKYEPEYVLLLQPTSPLRTSGDIDASVELAVENDAGSVVAVCDAPSHPFKVYRLNEGGCLERFVDKPDGYLPRQKLPLAYYENGAIYLVRNDVLREEKTLFPERTYPYVMPPSRSLQIDTPWDLQLIDLVLRDRENTTPERPGKACAEEE